MIPGINIVFLKVRNGGGGGRWREVAGGGLQTRAVRSGPRREIFEIKTENCKEISTGNIYNFIQFLSLNLQKLLFYF